MDPWRSNIGGPYPCDPCGVDAYDRRIRRVENETLCWGEEFGDGVGLYSGPTD